MLYPLLIYDILLNIFHFSEAWFLSNSLKIHRFRAQPPSPQSSYKMKWKTSKICFLQIFCRPFSVVLMKSYMINFQVWATQNKFLLSHPFSSIRANIYLSLLQLTTYLVPLIKKFTASMKVSKQIQKFKFPKNLFYFEMWEKSGRSGDQKLTIN